MAPLLVDQLRPPDRLPLWVVLQSLLVRNLQGLALD